MVEEREGVFALQVGTRRQRQNREKTSKHHGRVHLPSSQRRLLASSFVLSSLHISPRPRHARPPFSLKLSSPPASKLPRHFHKHTPTHPFVALPPIHISPPPPPPPPCHFHKHKQTQTHTSINPSSTSPCYPSPPAAASLQRPHKRQGRLPLRVIQPTPRADIGNLLRPLRAGAVLVRIPQHGDGVVLR
jgi:hypothetical protein